MDRSGQLDYVSDYFVRSFDAPVEPRLTEAEAAQAGIVRLMQEKAAYPERVHSCSLIGHRDEHGRDRLAYLVQYDECVGGEPAALVDATTGEVIEHWDSLCHGQGISNYQGQVSVNANLFHGGVYYLEDVNTRLGVFNAQRTQNGGTHLANRSNFWFDAGHRSGVEVLLNLRATYWYFILQHGWQGMNGTGGPRKATAANGTKVIHAVVNAAVLTPSGTTPNNAVNSSLKKRLSFGSGDGVSFGPMTSVDIVAH